MAPVWRPLIHEWDLRTRPGSAERLLPSSLWTGSPQTSFVVRLSRIHFSPLLPVWGPQCSQANYPEGNLGKGKGSFGARAPLLTHLCTGSSFIHIPKDLKSSCGQSRSWPDYGVGVTRINFNLTDRFELVFKGKAFRHFGCLCSSGS